MPAVDPHLPGARSGGPSMQPEYAVDGAKLGPARRRGNPAAPGISETDRNSARRKSAAARDDLASDRGYVPSSARTLRPASENPRKQPRPEKPCQPPFPPRCFVPADHRGRRGLAPLIAPKALVICDGHHRSGFLRPPSHAPREVCLCEGCRQTLRGFGTGNSYLLAGLKVRRNGKLRGATISRATDGLWRPRPVRFRRQAVV